MHKVTDYIGIRCHVHEYYNIFLPNLHDKISIALNSLQNAHRTDINRFYDGGKIEMLEIRVLENNKT